MKTTQSQKFYCRASKVNKDGRAPIEVGINISGRRVFLNLPRKEDPREFERGYDDLSNYLSVIRIRINEIITELTMNGEPVTADGIREYLRNGGRKSHTVKRVLDEALARVEESRLSAGATAKYRQVARMFLSVVDPMREVGSVTPFDIRAYEKLLSKYKPSSKAGMLVKLKTLLRRPMQEGLLTSDPFRDTKIVKPAPVITFLTEEELEMMREREFDIGRLAKVRDVALFQASCGLAYGDLRSLEPGDVKCDGGRYYICKERHKTGNTFIAPIIDGGEHIWFRYMGRLPLLSGQKQNAYLKEVADLCGIGKTLTTHLFRRTYATRLINSGVRLEVTAKALGHSQPTITLRHYASIRPDTVLDEVAKAFSK